MKAQNPILNLREGGKTDSGKKRLAPWLEAWSAACQSASAPPGLWSSQKILKAFESPAVHFRGLCFRQNLSALLLFREIGPVMEVDFLASLPEGRGQGLMKRLLLEAFELSLGTELWLEVHEKNAGALAFYQKIGMVQTGERKHYYQDGGRALLLTLKKNQSL